MPTKQNNEKGAKGKKQAQNLPS